MRDIPVVEVSLRRGPRNNSWIVKKCPYCGKRHEHGAGRSDQNPGEFLGGRVSHCSPGGQYSLHQAERVD
jgi:hypothetical protein